MSLHALKYKDGDFVAQLQNHKPSALFSVEVREFIPKLKISLNGKTCGGFVCLVLRRLQRKSSCACEPCLIDCEAFLSVTSLAKTQNRGLTNYELLLSAKRRPYSPQRHAQARFELCLQLVKADS